MVYSSSGDNFEVCVRAIIRHDNKILVCKSKEKKYYFFPGGHINFGEGAKEALLRELKEELNISIRKTSFIGVIENIYIEEGQRHHEINLVFDIEARKVNEQSKEDHIDFFLIDIKSFSRQEVLPIALKKALLKWLKDKKPFWASQIYHKSTFTS